MSKILCVDDDPGQLLALEGLLERMGHVCVPCNQQHTTAFKLIEPTPIDAYVEHFRGKDNKYDDIACRPMTSTTNG